MTDDVLRAVWDLLAEAPVRTVDEGPSRPVVLVDGRSGAGKSSWAQALAAAAPGPCTLVSSDVFCRGWEGLLDVASTVSRDVLSPDRPGFRRWDWVRGVPAEWVDLPVTGALVVEGAGVVDASSRAGASLAVWLEVDEATRRRWSLARDGAGYTDELWAGWAALEEEHLRRDRPRELADLVVCPAAGDSGTAWNLATIGESATRGRSRPRVPAPPGHSLNQEEGSSARRLR